MRRVLACVHAVTRRGTYLSAEACEAFAVSDGRLRMRIEPSSFSTGRAMAEHGERRPGRPRRVERDAGTES